MQLVCPEDAAGSTPLEIIRPCAAVCRCIAAGSCGSADQCLCTQLYLARGKMMGGSSSSNATLYARGSRADYDAWNMPNWTAQDALRAFIACEDNRDLRAPRLQGARLGRSSAHAAPGRKAALHDAQQALCIWPSACWTACGLPA